MKLYFSGADLLNFADYEPSEHIGKLFTFASNKKTLEKNLANSVNDDVFIDSGAFSMYHSGKKIDIDDYINYINSTSGVTVWAELDVIPYPDLNTKTTIDSAKRSWEQYLYVMERIDDSKRDSFIPIYHFGEPIEALINILETKVNGRAAPYIGIGGRHGVSKKAHDKYFENLFKVIKKTKNPNVKIHAFGMTTTELLEKYPFYSADSTTWLQMAINGWILLESQPNAIVSDRAIANPSANYWKKPPAIQEQIITEITKYGYSIEDLSKSIECRCDYNLNYFIRWVNNYKCKYNENNITRRRLF